MMSKDYKPRAQGNNNNGGGKGRGAAFFTGLLIGLLIGVGASVALTMYIKRGDSIFSDSAAISPSNESIVDKIARENADKKSTPSADSSLPKADSAEGENTADENKPDNEFDFYTILPETESSVSEQEIKANEATIKKDNYFLQVGAFQNVADADNMKAELALQGFEALVQTATIPNKGIWHRVRVGPLADIEQINKIRDDLTDEGFKADLIKVHTEITPQ